MLDSPIEIIYLIEFIAISVVRSIQATPYRRETFATEKKSTLDAVLMGLAGVAMLLPVVYLFSSWLDFANYPLPEWLGWVGVPIFAVGIWMLWRSHADLGRNWTPTLGLREDHKLITDGVFKHIRHPMYTAHLLWAIAAILMLPNWIAGPAFLVVEIAEVTIRLKVEEQMMVDQFGDEYREYMKRTGRFFPRIFFGPKMNL